MNTNRHQIEALEARIAPAATVVIDPVKLIATITADPVGDDITIIQDSSGLIDILNNANANASLTPSGTAEVILGIIYLGGVGDDKTLTQLQNGLLDVDGFITKPALPEGFIIIEGGGTNEHNIEAMADFVTIGKKFQFIGSTGDDTLSLKNLARTKDFLFAGKDGTDTLDIQNSSILGKLNLSGIEAMTCAANGVFGPTTVLNTNNLGSADIAIAADLINGAVKYTGSLNDDTFSLTGVVGGSITVNGGEGINAFSLTGTALKAIKFLGGADDDGFTITGTVLGAITANMGSGANAVDIVASMSGKSITLIGGNAVDTFNVTASNAGTLSAKLGADSDDISTAGSFKSLKLDAGIDSGTHNGAEKTLGKITRKNFI